MTGADMQYTLRSPPVREAPSFSPTHTFLLFEDVSMETCHKETIQQENASLAIYYCPIGALAGWAQTLDLTISSQERLISHTTRQPVLGFPPLFSIASLNSTRFLPIQDTFHIRS